MLALAGMAMGATPAAGGTCPKRYLLLAPSCGYTGRSSNSTGRTLRQLLSANPPAAHCQPRAVAAPTVRAAADPPPTLTVSHAATLLVLVPHNCAAEEAGHAALPGC